jgi:predicted transcriptional regulator
MSMRTTLTLDDDVATRVRAEARRTGRPFKVVLNDLLRTALVLRRELASAQPPFRVRARGARIGPGLNFDNVGELLEQLEGPGHR